MSFSHERKTRVHVVNNAAVRYCHCVFASRDIIVIVVVVTTRDTLRVIADGDFALLDNDAAAAARDSIVFIFYKRIGATVIQ